MLKKLNTFFRRENGAVTVDWVVLTALIIALVTAIVSMMGDATGTLTGRIGSHLADTDL